LDGALESLLRRSGRGSHELQGCGDTADLSADLIHAGADAAGGLDGAGGGSLDVTMVLEAPAQARQGLLRGAALAIAAEQGQGVAALLPVGLGLAGGQTVGCVGSASRARTACWGLV